MKILVLHPIIYDFINFRYRLYDIFLCEAVKSHQLLFASATTSSYSSYSLHVSHSLFRLICVMHQKVRSQYVSCAFLGFLVFHDYAIFMTSSSTRDVSLISFYIILFFFISLLTKQDSKVRIFFLTIFVCIYSCFFLVAVVIFYLTVSWHYGNIQFSFSSMLHFFSLLSRCDISTHLFFPQCG